MVRPRACECVLLFEPDEAMREILIAELRAAVPVPIEACSENVVTRRGLVVALPTRAARLPAGVCGLALKLRSIDAELGQPARAPEGFLISIVSRSGEILESARAILIAVGVAPDAIQQVDAGESGWQARLGLSGLIVADVVSAADLPGTCPVRVFRVIADSSLEELKRLCGV
jgi:hypothetical protein